MTDEPLAGASRPAAAGRPSARGTTPARRGVFASLSLFIRQILDELRKVVRPTRQEWLTYTAVVIAFVVTIMLFVFGLDTLFAKLVALVFAGDVS